MNFYSMHGQNQEYSLNILELSGIRFLFLRSYPSDRMLYYLPECDIGEQQQEETTDAIKKKQRIEDNGRTFSTKSVMDIESGQDSNPYYLRVKERDYIRGGMRFDLTYLNNIDHNSIEYILLTSIEDLFVLPYLLKQKKMRARVFATVPVQQIGEHVLVERYKLVCDRNRRANELHNSQKDSFFAENEFLDHFERQYDLEVNQWVDIFTQEEIQKTFASIETMSYGQKLQLEGTDIVIEPVSSGHSVGSCLWIIEHKKNKIAMLNNASRHSHRYPLGLEEGEKLRESVDFFLISPCLSTSKEYNNLLAQTGADTFAEACLLRFVQTTQNVLTQSRQNVVIPIQDGGILLDLLDILERKLACFVRHIFVISESAMPYIQLGNSNVESLNTILQRKIFCEHPSSPFSAYESLHRSQTMTIFSDFIAFQQSSKFLTLQSMVQSNTPSLYLIVDSSLRLGNVFQLLKLIDESAPKQAQFSSSLLLVDPQMQSPHVVAPLLGLYRTQVLYAPLDTRIHLNEFCNYLRVIKPKHLFYPRKYQEIQIFLENLRLETPQIKILASVYGNDEGISLPLLNNHEHSLFMPQSHVSNLSFQRNDKLPFLPPISLLHASLNINSDGIITILNSDDKCTNPLDTKRAILFAPKNSQTQRDLHQNITSVIVIQMTTLGFTNTSKLFTIFGFKLIFRNPKNSEITYVEHDHDVTSIYSSSKENTIMITNILKQKLNIIEFS